MTSPSLIQFLPLVPLLCTRLLFFFPLTAYTFNVLNPGVQASREINLTLSDLGLNFQQESLIQLRLDAHSGPLMSDEENRVWGGYFRVQSLAQHFAAMITIAYLSPSGQDQMECSRWGCFQYRRPQCRGLIENYLFALNEVDHKMEFLITKLYWFNRLMWATS